MVGWGRAGGGCTQVMLPQADATLGQLFAGGVFGDPENVRKMPGMGVRNVAAILPRPSGSVRARIKFAGDSLLEGDGFGLTALSDYPKNPKIPPFSVWR
jgi:hypothetical protein